MTLLGFDYEHMAKEERPFAYRLAVWIDSKVRSDVVDLGAGTGVYVEELRKFGLRARGYDIADPQPRPDLVQQKSMLEVDDPAGVVLCLEVAEHIDSSLAPQVIESVWRNCGPKGTVIWSAAQPGQGGVGHINCQPPEYWSELALAQGFVRDPVMEEDLHQWITAGYHMGWFANNRQIWRKI